jgi:folate-binding protein YgfZ
VRGGDPSPRHGPRGARAEALLAAGEVVAEVEALARGAGLVPLLGLLAVEVTGTQAIGFLHRILSQDVRGIPDGSGRLALLLEPKGRVLADLFVWRRGAAALLVLEPGAAVRALPALERYVVADDVVLTDVSAAWRHLLLAGARVPEVLDRCAEALRGLGACLARADLRARPAARLLVPAPALDAVVAALRGAGAVLAGEEAFDVARVETLWPWYGAELDERALPNEAVHDAAISWTKGCYVGQEPVVMARHRGHPSHRLVRLVFADGAPPAVGSVVRLGAAPAGRVTTAVRCGGLTAALAYLRWDLAQVGAVFAVGESPGREARIDALAE